MRQMLCLGFLVMGSVFAQVYDSGVTKGETDDGRTYCFYSAKNSTEDPIRVQVGMFDNVLSMSISHGTDDGAAFDSFGPTGSELVRLRFPDGAVESFKPDDLQVNLEYGFESATTENGALIDKVLSLTENLYVRFEGDNRKDFIVNHEVFTTLDKGFARECR